MPAVRMQFHALAEEIADFILMATEENSVHFVIITSPPISFREVLRDDFKEEVIRCSLVETQHRLTVYMLLTPPDLSETKFLKFCDSNPGGIVVDIGLHTSLGLEQSGLGTTIKTNPEIYGLAKKMVKQLKKSTNAGVTAINIATNERSLAKSFRYTDKVALLESKGVAMLPIAGGGKLVLGDMTKQSG